MINLTEPDAELTTTKLPPGTISDNEEAPIINLTKPGASKSLAKKKQRTLT